MTPNKNLSPRRFSDEERHRKLVTEGIPQGLQAQRYNPDWTLKDAAYPRVLGLGGRLRSGKDEVADHLVRAHGWAKVGMSDAVHEFLLAQNPDVFVKSGDPYVSDYVEIIEQHGYVEAKKLNEIRSLMQRTGTEAGRGVLYEDVWADAARNRMLAHMAEGRSVVLTGVRFENELNMIRGLKGVAAFVYRPVAAAAPVTAPEVVSALDAALAHSSETSVRQDQFDLTIPNDGTLTDLYEWVDQFARAEETVERHWPHYDH